MVSNTVGHSSAPKSGKWSSGMRTRCNDHYHTGHFRPHEVQRGIPEAIKDGSVYKCERARAIRHSQLQESSSRIPGGTAGI